MKAAFRFRNSISQLPSNELKTVTNIEVHLYGSLSATGKGHGTDRAIAAGLLGWQPETCDTEALSGLLSEKNKLHITIDPGISIPFGPHNIHFGKVHHSYPFNNTMVMQLMSNKKILLEKEYYSVGGGFVQCKDEVEPKRPAPPYPYTNMAEFKKNILKHNISLVELMLCNEEVLTGLTREHIFSRLDEIAEVMERSVKKGISTEGVLPGPIGLFRKSGTLYRRADSLTHTTDKFLVLLNAYALAASEENAAGHLVVTAPTSGASGVIPALLYLLKHHMRFKKHLLLEGLIAAAVVGFIAKHNASISGAEVGCQGEIGVASSMGAALVTHVNGHPVNLVENAAEIALEHHLGITCDPIDGYVQIPCIERNAVGAVEAYNSYLLASTGDPRKQKLSLDQVIEAMLETGRDMSAKYKETSKGGLAVCAVNC